MDMFASEHQAIVRDTPPEVFELSGEGERLAALQGLDFNGYCDYLVTLHNQVLSNPDGSQEGFTDRPIVAVNPFSHDLIRYLEPHQRLPFLRYAHELAQASDSVERAAFIECSAVYLGQPFIDGNKVTARNLYLALQGWEKQKRLGSNLLWATEEA